MKFSPVEQILKNGQSVIIREASKKDAGRLLEAVSRNIVDSEHLLTTIEEFNPTVRDEKRWIETLNHAGNCLLLIATHDKKIIGSIDLKGEMRKRTKHNALLGIAIVKEWRNIGLGSLLMEAAINWARKSGQIETIWLNVFATHTHAIALYKKNGFEEVFKQKDFIKLKDGVYIDNLVMRLNLS